MNATPAPADPDAAPASPTPDMSPDAVCEWCKEPFRRHVEGARFCKDLCRNRAWRAAEKQRKSPALSLEKALSDALSTLRRGEPLSKDLAARVRAEMDAAYPAPRAAAPKGAPAVDDLRGRFKVACKRIKGLQTRAAAALGCGQPALSDFSAGRRGLPPERAKALAAYLDGQGF